MLDHRLGHDVPPMFVQQAVQWLKTLGGPLPQQLELCVAGKGPFESANFESQSKPDVWWAAGVVQGFPWELSLLAHLLVV